MKKVEVGEVVVDKAETRESHNKGPEGSLGQRGAAALVR